MDQYDSLRLGEDRSLFHRLRAFLESYPEIKAVVAWNPKESGRLLHGSAPGVPMHAQELLAQLMLSNILRRSPMLLRSGALAGGNEAPPDEHALWLSLACSNHLAVVVEPSARLEGAEGIACSTLRLDILHRCWQEAPEAIGAIERALALDPDDADLWTLYLRGCDARWGTALPEDRWRIRQQLRCVRRSPDAVIALNEMAGYYEQNRKPFLAALCRLRSLNLKPDQAATYDALRAAWERGLFTPEKPPLDPENACMVSVILCTYNRPDGLVRALASVLEQTYTDYEVLVVNDGGDPVAEEVVAGFNSPRVRYLCCQHGGHRVAMNTGLRAARGKYIAYLDDDDIYYPNHLETLVHAAESQDLAFVCARNRWLQGHWEGETWVEDWVLDSHEDRFRSERLRMSSFIGTNAVLHRRALVSEIGLFWEEPPRGGDWEYWFRCSRQVRMERTETATTEYRVLTASLPMRLPAQARFFTELWRVYFGSEFGAAVMAAAAWHNGQAAACCAYLERLKAAWPELHGTFLDLLFPVAVSARRPLRQAIMRRIGRHHTTWLLHQVACQMRSGAGLQVLRSLPLHVYADAARFLLRHPGKIAARLFSQRPVSAQ